MTRSKPAPILLIAGGPQAENNDIILSAVMKLTSAQHPVIAYIGTASNDDKPFFNMFKQRFIAAGAADVTLVPLVRQFDRPRAEAILKAGDLIFVSGGEVARGMDILKKRQLTPFLTGLYRSGKPFFGVSAGRIMLWRNWVRWHDPNDDNTAELMECLGFAPLLCDVHAEEDNWEELKKLMSFFPKGTKGYGIPAGGALHVTKNGKITTLGIKPVQFVKKGNNVILHKP